MTYNPELEEQARKKPYLLMDARQEDTDKAYEITLQPVWLHYEDNKPRNYSDENPGLKDMSLTFREWLYEWSSERKLHSYYQFGYHTVYFIELEGLEEKARYLKAINRKLDKMKVEYGTPVNLAQYIIRILRALPNCGGLIIRTGGDKGWSYTDSEYQTYEQANDIEYQVNRMQTKARETMANRYQFNLMDVLNK